MSWRAKIWFFNSGNSAILAIILATTGSPLCFVFGLLAGLYWHIGNVMIERTKQGE